MEQCSNCLCDSCDNLESCKIAPQRKDPIRPNPCASCKRGKPYIPADGAGCQEYAEKQPSRKPQLAEAIKFAIAEKINNTLLPEPDDLDTIQIYIRTTSNHIRLELDAKNDILWRMQPC